MEWNNFSPLEIRTPDEITEEVIQGFEKATNDLVSLALIKKSDIAKINSKLSNNFIFDLILYSKHMDGYSFKILEFGYDVDVYPVQLIIEPEIFRELKYLSLSQFGTYKVINEESFYECLNAIFKTHRFGTITGGLMKIAAKELNS